MSDKTLSILIPARNEEFLNNTIEDILSNIEGDTEILVGLDEVYQPVIKHEKVTVLHYPESIGQRAMTNQLCRLSKAKYVMKCDAHVSFDKGFDVKMMAEMKDNWTLVPRQYNLHCFSWQCTGCKKETYQGPKPETCGCGGTEHIKDIKWRQRKGTKSDSMRFDSDLRFKYWGAFQSREEAKGDISPTMSLLGACWMIDRQRYWELNICDEAHGSWGQQGTEVACKTWLSGGQVMVNKKTWFAHMFRTQKDFSFPYHQSGNQVNKARAFSQDLWRNNKFEKQIYPFSWLLEKFWPIPDWTEEQLAELKKVPLKNKGTKGIIYYTTNKLNLKIAKAVQKQLLKIGLPIVSASLKPMNFGTNIVIKEKPGHITMFKQIVAALENLDTEIVYFCEHDVIYSPTHFEFSPTDNKFYFNNNVWKVDAETGKALKVEKCEQLSGMCVYRATALEWARKKLEEIKSAGFDRHYEPQNTVRGGWESKEPNIDIRHSQNLTPNRWSKEEFRNPEHTKGWQEADASSLGWNIKELIWQK